MTRRAFVALAIGAPVAFALLHHDLGHTGDLAFFHEWLLAFHRGPAFYADGTGLNYPILGVLLVCLPSWLVGAIRGAPLDLAGFLVVHKAVLVVGETLVILAAARLARALGRSRPRVDALLLYALPSTWAGGAWFGQIDVYGTLALLLAADGLLRYHREGGARDLAVGIGAMHAALLLKQLTWFALPPLGLLALLGLVRHRDVRRAALVAVSPLLWLAPDPLLVLPDGHTSHLAFVVMRSTRDHGVFLVASGASVWSLWPRSSELGAHDPLVGPLSASTLGVLAWLAAQLSWLARPKPATLVWGAGWASLSMALLMTGVHDRYFAHAIPFLFLTTRGAARGLTAALGVVSGLFVLSSVHGELTLLGRPEPVVGLGLALMAIAPWRRHPDSELRPPDDRATRPRRWRSPEPTSGCYGRARTRTRPRRPPRSPRSRRVSARPRTRTRP